MTAPRAKPLTALAVSSGLLLPTGGVPAQSPGDSGPPQLAVRVDQATTAEQVRIAVETGVPLESIEHPSPHEVVLRYTGAIDGTPVQSLPGSLEDWVAGVQYGYDSVLIVFTEPIRMQLDPTRAGIAMQVSRGQPETRSADAPASEPDAASASDKRESLDDAGLQKELLRTRYLARTGRTAVARAELTELARQNPENADILATRADINRQTGRWIPALEDYRDALDRRPQSEFLNRSYRELLDARRPFVSARIDWRLAGSEDSRVRNFYQARDYLSERLEIYANARSDFASIENVRREDGELRDFDGVRHRGALELRYHREDGDRVSGMLFASRGGPGAGLAYDWIEPDADTRFEATVLEPAWGFTEGFVQGGTVDRVSLDRRQSFGDLKLSGGLGLRNYRLETDSLARSLAVRARGTYNLRPDKPSLAMSYGVDAEYPLSVDGVTRNGVTFEPLPVENREVHSFELTGSYLFQDGIELQAGAGFAIDRYGGAGPSSFARAIIPLGPDWQLTAGLSQSVDLSDTDTLVTIAGIELRWRFADTPADGLRSLFD
ncbi:hypothetical protein CKO28_14780 [Rhodovibrio sodomensis]|uniref:Tetratricopeptide repeat protein n=1 Tax=Rhodovibrio sodomensis TaxID=1088 RepID=A0ABS1DFR7_9PROT|nr:hypothetical protein [Rhodovibrio sodomensis]MBK1669300.1 hypothetical protein [Rhodovibrio sodomensis]